MDKLLSKRFGPYLVIFVAAITVYGLIYLFSDGFNITAHNWWNNYSRQAYSWLNGRLDLPENRDYLEIAMFDGRYYISFPPFPSVVLLPLVAVFGYNTPDHVVAFGFALLSLVFAYKIAEKLLEDKKHAMFFSLFLILGTNYLHISLWGAVWYLAQNMAFAFTLIAIYFALTNKNWHSYLSLFFMCAAMGCRPFNAVYVPAVIFLLYRRGGASIVPFAKKLLVYAIPAIALGCFFMWLNYARFGNIFEFGHNFLPEFTRDPDGQFHFNRIPRNLGTMFLNTDIAHGILNGFPFVGQVGFAFWLASPILVSFVVYLGIWVKRMFWKKGVQAKKQPLNDPVVWMLLGAVILHLLLFSLHRTLGGRQFGSRYAIDSLPAIYLGMMLVLSKLRVTANHIYANAAPMAFGLLINFHGTIMFFIFYFPHMLRPWG